MSPDSDATIVAQATPPGRSGIGLLRLSGPLTLKLTRQLIADPGWVPQPKRASLKILRNPSDGEVLDRALITYFQAPHSFTGEDVIEISCHGSPLVLSRVLESLLVLGGRVAAPGEFTLRALSHGKLNLSQAEAIRDLIAAQTEAAAKHATRQLGGELSARLQPAKDALIELIVPLESSLEFVEEDLPQLVAEDIGHKLRSLAKNLEDLSLTFRSGKLLKDGLKIALAGRPNVGKSSVFNRLLMEDRAIVTPVPGTTRDSLSELLSINGVPVLLTDTAGVRESQDVVEYLGIERTKRSIAESDLVVLIFDGSEPLTEDDQRVFEAISPHRTICALNKSDAPSYDPQRISHLSPLTVISISAQTGQGLHELREAMLEPFGRFESGDTGFLITNVRHYDLLRRAVDAIHSSIEHIEEHRSEELIVVGLYDALRYLGDITGETTTEEMLTQIFSTFCIGK